MKNKKGIVEMKDGGEMPLTRKQKRALFIRESVKKTYVKYGDTLSKLSHE